MAPTSACHVLVVIFVEAKLISKTSEFFFGTYGLFMVREKVEEVLFLIWNISKTIHKLRSQIA